MLRGCLASVQSQTLRDVEIIVSDNASTDNTSDVLATVQDPRVRYAPLAENVGLFGNISRCLTLGTGVFRVVLHDDDLLLSGALERAVRFLQRNPSVGMLHGSFLDIAADGQPTGQAINWPGFETSTIMAGRDFIRRSLACGGMVNPATVMLRSAAVADEEFREADGPCADLALWMRIACHYDIGFLPEALAGARLHDGSASAGFGTVRVTGGERRTTASYADAIHLAHKRFVDELSDTDPDRVEFAHVVEAFDRKLRQTLLFQRWVPDAVWKRGKSMARVVLGSGLYERLALRSGRLSVALSEPVACEREPASGVAPGTPHA